MGALGVRPSAACQAANPPNSVGQPENFLASRILGGSALPEGTDPSMSLIVVFAFLLLI